MIKSKTAAELIEEADIYSRMALDYLMLEDCRMTAETAMQVMVLKEFDGLLTHFLFPNLSAEERKFIRIRTACSGREEFKHQFAEATKKVDALEGKLTAIQMEILELPPFKAPTQ